MKNIKTLLLIKPGQFWIGSWTVLLGIGINLILMSMFKAQYTTALHQIMESSFNLLAAVLALPKAIFSWCYMFTGPFIFVLAPILIFSITGFGRFLKAHVQGQPIPLNECKYRYDSLNWIGSTLCGQIGIFGTLVYAIAALLTLGRAIGDLSSAFSETNGFQTMMMPNILAAMADAALTMAPALGTTAVAVVSETFVESINRICQRWHGELWQGSQAAEE